MTICVVNQLKNDSYCERLQFSRFQMPFYVLKYQCLIILMLKETFDPRVSFLFLEKWMVKTFRFYAQLSKGIWHMAYYDVVSRRSLPVLIFPAYFPVLLLQFDKLFIVFLVCYTYMIYVHKIAYVSPLYQFLPSTNFNKFSKFRLFLSTNEQTRFVLIHSDVLKFVLLCSVVFRIILILSDSF